MHHCTTYRGVVSLLLLKLHACHTCAIVLLKLHACHTCVIFNVWHLCDCNVWHLCNCNVWLQAAESRAAVQREKDEKMARVEAERKKAEELKAVREKAAKEARYAGYDCCCGVCACGRVCMSVCMSVCVCVCVCA